MGAKVSGRQRPKYPWKFNPLTPELAALSTQSRDHSALAKTGLVAGPPEASQEAVSFVSVIRASLWARSPASIMVCSAVFSRSRISGDKSAVAAGTGVPSHGPLGKLYVVG